MDIINKKNDDENLKIETYKNILNNEIKIIYDFPYKNMIYANIDHIIINNKLSGILFELIDDIINDKFNINNIDYFVEYANDSFIGPILAYKYNKGYIPIRKLEKTKNYPYDDSIYQNYCNKNVILVDKLISNGINLYNMYKLCKNVKLNVIGCICIVDINCDKNKQYLNIKDKLENITFSLILY
jgi:adenine/guanine phosphoribosyltransferase-like PRPP-binding protein